jgi:redox-sensitive bicupin YhaK (pirin superfamily)
MASSKAASTNDHVSESTDPPATDLPAIDPPAIDTPADWAPLFRPAAERFHSQLDWLDSWHSFSFSSHVDPAWMGFGPLRVINDDTIAAGQGFGMHPHRDMEIVTVMVEGQLNHRDSMGHAEVLRAGEVQRMSAGTGVVHSEVNEGSQPCRLLQIWIEPAALAIPPAYEQKPFEIAAGWTPLLDPERRDGAMALCRPVHLWRAQLGPNAVLALPALPAGAQAPSHHWLQLIDGSVDWQGVTPLPLQRGDGLGWQTARSGVLKAGKMGSDLLLFALR